jgi:hypothetical protein
MLTKNALKTMLSKTYDSASTYEVPTKFSVGTGTTTPTINDTTLDTQVEIETGVEEKVFITGYPILDLDNLSVKFRLFLNSLEANGNELTEVGIWEKGNDTLFSRNVFTAQNKTSSVEISIIKSDKWVNPEDL